MVTRRTAGRRANRKGRAWEAQISASAARYRREGRAMVRQAHADRKRGPGPVDFGGPLAGGRAFLAEAKSTKEARWSFKLLAAHQARQLRDAHALGAVAGILLRTHEGAKDDDGNSLAVFTWVPWERFGDDWFRWLEKRPGAHASITPDVGVPIPRDANGLPDWLPAVLA